LSQTGNYLHNGGALDNTLAHNCYGPDWQRRAEHSTFAVHAQAAGYQTSYAGKYLNQYRRPRVPPGWSTWYGLEGNSVYYDYSLVVQNDTQGGFPAARIEHHGNNYATDYLPNVLTNITINTIRQFAATSDKPFLIVQGWPSPHAPFTPAPIDEHFFAGHPAPRTPNYNATNTNWNKHWMMRQLTALTDDDAAAIDEIYQRRLETLLTVDRNIGDLLRALEETSPGVRHNTYVIFMSDNGFQLGQHRLPADKRQLYEHDIRIPLVVSGPGVPKGIVSQEVVLNIDISPTITELTTVDQRDRETLLRDMDGQSFVPLLVGEPNVEEEERPHHFRRREEFLISYHGEPYNSFTTRDTTNNTYHCVRTIVMKSNEDTTYETNDIFCRFEDDEHFVEYYDMTVDEWQLRNSFDALTDDEIWNFDRRLTLLKSCHGETCRRQPLDPIAQPELLVDPWTSQ